MTRALQRSSLALDDGELRRRFAREGYLFFPQALPTSKARAARSALLDALREGGLVDARGRARAEQATPSTQLIAPQRPREAAIVRAMQRRREFHALTRDARVAATIARLIDEPVFMHPRKIIRVVAPERTLPGSYVEPHQDFRFLQGTADSVTAWMPLGAYSERAGGLRVLAGSHRGGLLPVVERGEQLAIEIAVSDPRWRCADYRPGDLLLMHALVVHAAPPNLSARLRLTLDVRIQPTSAPICAEALRAPYPVSPGVDAEDPASWSFDPWLQLPEALELRERLPPLSIQAAPASRLAPPNSPMPMPKSMSKSKSKSKSKRKSKSKSKSNKATKRCAVLVPIGVSIERDCELALQELDARGYRIMRLYGHSAIDQARSLLATMALDEGYEELMWIDADVGFDPDDVDRLRALELPFSCGIYPKKGPREFAFSPLPETRRLRFGAKGGLHEVLYVGMGFVHTRREVYEAVRTSGALPECNQRFDRPIVPYFLPMLVPDGDSSWYLGEDFAFCERVRRAGYPIMADTTIRLRHIGRYAYTWDDAAGPQRKRKDSVTCRIQQPGRFTAAVDYPLSGRVERVLHGALELTASGEGSDAAAAMVRRAARSRSGLRTLRADRRELIASGEEQDPPGRWGVAKVELAPRLSATVEHLQAYLFGREVELDLDEAKAQADFFRLVARVAEQPHFVEDAERLAPLLAFGRLMQRATRPDALASLETQG